MSGTRTCLTGTENVSEASCLAPHSTFGALWSRSLLKARAFRVPVQLQRSGDAVPHIKLRFRGGSYGSMHGDNHCGWAITGLLLSDEAQLTPAARASLADADRLDKAALRDFSYVAPFDDINATAMEESSAGRPSLAKVFGPERHLPAMPLSTDTYVGQGGRRLAWKTWSDAAPVPIMDLSMLLASDGVPLTDGMLGFAWTCIRPRDGSAHNATLSLSTSGLGAVFWNGLLVAKDELDLGVSAGEMAVQVALTGGAWSSLLIKSAHNERPGASRWALLAAVFDGVTPLPIEVDATCGAYSAGWC